MTNTKRSPKRSSDCDVRKKREEINGDIFCSIFSGNNFTPPELITLSYRPNHIKC